MSKLSNGLRIGFAQLNPTVGDLKRNADKIIKAVKDCITKDPTVELVVLPECVTTGYPIEDLVNRPKFIDETRKIVTDYILPSLKFGDVGILFGTPWTDEEYNESNQSQPVYNAALLVVDGEIKTTRYKYDLPNYGVFDEKRTFATKDYIEPPIMFNGVALGVMVCQDMWGNEKTGEQAVPDYLAKMGAEIFIVLNGSPYETDKVVLRKAIAASLVDKYNIPLMYVNLVGGQDELVFDGGTFITLAQGDFIPVGLSIGPLFKEYIGSCTVSDNDYNTFKKCNAKNINTFHAGDSKLLNLAEDYTALVVGLRDYMNKNGFKKAVLGLSGGVDSTLVAAIAADAIGAENVYGVMLPSKYSSDGSVADATEFAKRTGIETTQIPIESVVQGFRDTDINNFGLRISEGNDQYINVTDENLQARARGVILMGVSNASGALLLTTGNKSEVSVGYSTLYGDMNGGFNPLKDVYKTTAFELCYWRNQNIPDISLCTKENIIPTIIIQKPPSAELAPDQVDTNSLPPYHTLDAWLRLMIDEEKSLDVIMSRYPSADVDMLNKVRRLVDLAEYKRRQSAPGTKITSRMHGNDRRYPITNRFKEMV